MHATKLCCLWIPNGLTKNQKNPRQETLKLIGKGHFCYMAVNEAWLHYYGVLTKITISNEEFDAIFLKSSGVVHLVVDTAKWCTEQFLSKVIESLKNLRLNSRMHFWFLCHRTSLVIKILYRLFDHYKSETARASSLK